MSLFKRTKGKAVWVKPEDYFKATKAVEKAGLKTFSRVSVRYIDSNTAVYVSIIWSISSTSSWIFSNELVLCIG